MEPWIWAYSDRLSAKPGETVWLHISGTGGTADIEVARLGQGRAVAATIPGIEITLQPIAHRPDVNGCGWAATCALAVGDWASGYYEIVLTAADGAVGRHMLVVRAPAARAGAVLVLATNTYQAYNCWGGSNAYVWVGGPAPAAVPDAPEERYLATVLSAERPFSAGQMKPASSRHRIVNEAPRGFGEAPTAGEIAYEAGAGGEIQDCPAGFVDKWEHAFVAWAEAAGYGLDYLTDHDLETDAGALAAYDVAVVVGHSEYWSWNQRLQFEQFVDAGGRAIFLSGNTCYWQVRWEEGGRKLVLFKSQAQDLDPVVRDPARRHLATSLWSGPLVARPEAALTGLSFVFGGYHRFGNCVARGTCGYTVLDEDHWALAGSDLYWGDVFGQACRLVGFENDGAPFTFDEDGRARAVPRLGVPANLEIIAHAPATLYEPPGALYDPIVMPEAMELLTRAVAGYDSPAIRARLRRGSALVATFKRGLGQVFNGGTTDWAYGLSAGDVFVDRITRNVLDHFLAAGAAASGAAPSAASTAAPTSLPDAAPAVELT